MSAPAIALSPSTLATPARTLSDTKPARARQETSPNAGTPARASALEETIRTLGGLLDDLERIRIANGNRIGALEREHGDALSHLRVIQEGLAAVEHEAELELRRAWRRHPLAAWAKEIPGAGETLMGRLIAIIGDPASRPNPAKLLAYCGHGDPARSAIPKRATQAELFKRGNPAAKKATWKLAYQFMRTVGGDARPRSPYRDLYEERKAASEGKLHQQACARCGPSGHPAEPGSPWSDAHRNADALRIVGKRFLLDLWKAARALHTGCDSPATCESRDATGDVGGLLAEAPASSTQTEAA